VVSHLCSRHERSDRALSALAVKLFSTPASSCWDSMKNKPRSSESTHVAVTDRVTFMYQERTRTGTVVKKGRTRAHVVCDDQREVHILYTRLTKLPGAAPQAVQSRADQQRARFAQGDRVQFAYRGTIVRGILARLNPTRGHVATDYGQEYRVSYGLLHHTENMQAISKATRRTTAFAALARRARALLAHHGLTGWSFQFDQGRKRAGCCQYATQVISLSYAFAQQAPEAEITDTILHEIAHALVGKAHNHDEVWRTKAQEIGCSGRRCHDRQFVPPRYIVTCARHCWVATADRRRRGVVCLQCRGRIVYQTYTEERWSSEQQHV
jgi:predicted SprT family Zn-dependent metalloprotease